MFVRAYSIGYAKHMRVILLSFLVLFMCCLGAETVYKTVDEDGNIIFTDKPSKGSEEIKLQELQTIKNPNPAKYSPTPKKSKPIDANVYNTFLISNPADGSGLRSNNGNVTISLALEPPLRPGNKIVITMDGQEVSNGSASSVSLQNIDRGTHSVGASVVDGNGEKLISTSSSFSMLRASQ
jgi:uncharacterized protein DUF4124